METPIKMKFKKGDMVVVITGREKGKTGSITKVMPASNRVVIAGVNVVKKATKANPQTGEGGGFVEKEASIHASNVMFWDAVAGKGSRKRPS